MVDRAVDTISVDHRRGNHVGRLGWIQLAVSILKQCKYPDDDHEWLMGLKEYVVSLDYNEVSRL